MPNDQRDVIEILIHDHREVEQMFTELESLVGMDDEASYKRRKDLVDQATIELVRHSVAEEAEVYPRVKEKVSDTEAERAKPEHAEAEITMKKLEALQPSESMFDQQLATLMQEIREHVAEEEGQMFPHMRTIFTPDELLDMGAKVERVKRRPSEDGAHPASSFRARSAAGGQDPRPGDRNVRPDARRRVAPRHRLRTTPQTTVPAQAASAIRRSGE